MDEPRNRPRVTASRPGATRERPGGKALDASAVLDDRYRRHVVDCLGGGDGPIPVADLARDVVGSVAGKSPDAVTLDEQKRMYTALDRTHLPALAAADLVDWDRGGDVVALADGVAGPEEAVGVPDPADDGAGID